jgi:hypothetical protein
MGKSVCNKRRKNESGQESLTGKQKAHSRRYHDLDWLFGTWNKKQSADFQKHLAETRKIDLELWE